MAPELRIDVLHNEIIVTMPGTGYTVTYYKPKESRILLAKHQSGTEDQRATGEMSHASVLMVRCPTTGRELSTGVEMDDATFERLPHIRSRLNCPLCRADHNWSTREAWLGNPAPSVPSFAWLFINNQTAAND
jgi:hypothetical protein